MHAYQVTLQGGVAGWAGWMEDQELESPWSQLVFIGEGGEKEVIPIIGSQLSIGRKSG